MLLYKFMPHQRRSCEPFLTFFPTRTWEEEADTVVPKDHEALLHPSALLQKKPTFPSRGAVPLTLLSGYSAQARASLLARPPLTPGPSQGLWVHGPPVVWCHSLSPLDSVGLGCDFVHPAGCFSVLEAEMKCCVQGEGPEKS